MDGTGNDCKLHVDKNKIVTLLVRFKDFSLFCRTSYVKSIDGNWGSLQPNGSFDGMIGMIERKEVDCAVSGFGLMKERSRVADYLNPTGYLRFVAKHFSYVTLTISESM